MKYHFLSRDVSWLSFNERVLQEASDTSVPLSERIKFLGIHSNNMDEFFKVRVAGIKRIITVDKNKKKNPQNKNWQVAKDAATDMHQIQQIVLKQQEEFSRIWEGILQELGKKKIYLKTDKDLTSKQESYVENFFDEVVASNVIPLLLNNGTHFPYLRDKSLYLGVAMHKGNARKHIKFALIEIPVHAVGRFIRLPTGSDETHIMLLEDVIRYNLKYIFSYFGFDHYKANIFKLTKDAEFDYDNDINLTIAEKVEKGVKNRRKGRPVRLIYDKDIDSDLLSYLKRKLKLAGNDTTFPGGRIHNFRHFIEFPDVIQSSKKKRRNKPFLHPAFKDKNRISDILLKQDVLLSTPYHSFKPIIDLLREAAMDPEVLSIKITAYRLAENSKIINALINAVRNGKKVTVMMELKARFDEEANLIWKEKLEVEGVTVLVGIPDMKVHAKICVIKKKIKKGSLWQYGFVSTGNLNEKTARVYSDHTLLTCNKKVMADINKIFHYLEKYPKLPIEYLKKCHTLVMCPVTMRDTILKLMENEIKNAKADKPAKLTLKVNALSDKILIDKIYEAAEAGVEIEMIVRGVFCAVTKNKNFKKNIFAISIIDEYLEHARVMIFHNHGKERIFISSADWMPRNLDHRIEAAVELTDANIKQEIKEIMKIQRSDNVKARLHNTDNEYVQKQKGKKVRSQLAIYNYLKTKADKTTAKN